MMWMHSLSAPNYEVSENGDIRRRDNHKIVKSCIGKRWGYRLANLKVGEKWKTMKVHRLVCEAFHGPPPIGKNDTAHADGCRTNNRYTNLRWATRKENMADAMMHGTIKAARGSANKNARLTEADVIAIRAHTRRKGLLNELAAKYGVSRNVVGNIRTKGSPCWNHIR